MPFDTTRPAAQPALTEALRRALRAIPPAWPLAATVAVNPFLGQAEEDLATAAARLARVGGLRVTPPRAAFAAKLAAGEITEEDLAAALAACPWADRPADVAALRAALAAPEPPPPRAVPGMAELAAAASGTDWPGILAERFGAFCAAWFDEGQALWPIQHRGGLYAAWRAVALRDLTPEIHGLSGFCAHAAGAPQAEEEAIERALAALGVPDAAIETLLHRLLMDLGGWAQLARQRLFVAERDGGTDRDLLGLLAARLLWEAALHARFGEAVAEYWAASLAAHAAPVVPCRDQILDAVLQEAAERAAQRRLLGGLALPGEPAATRPKLQAAFCIDVRSEVFRRALEARDAGIRTLGFAGFFGLPVAHRPFGSVREQPHLPVLLGAKLRSCTAVSGTPQEEDARIAARARRAWGRFAHAAVSSFAFVESAGLLHGVNLLADSFGLGRKGKAEEPPPRAAAALAPDQKIAVAETVLRAMSLTAGFAPLVLLAGHGARVVNNPHASALACGACGGYQGDVSARLLAALLNDAEVRSGLAGRGIAIPEDTLFVAALHDTTTDAVTLYDADTKRTGHEAALAQAAVSSFAFVESAGLLHALGLAKDSAALARCAKAEPAPVFSPALPLEARIATAEAVLRAMSLTRDFAPLVLLVGHGARVENNPHASALACGACGGEAGDVSARLLALLLNDAAVREGLAARGIAIPADTRFVAGLHDTVSDEVRLFAADLPAPPPGLAQAEAWLADAALITRTERARRLPRGAAATLPKRGADWAETRPEWALAGCAAFLAAPRSASAGRDLGGRVFLHDYDWRADEGFGVLELILTAPVVVASWIGLQYYGSVVAPEAFGGGNKLLHNVVGGVGVVEGNGGPLRTGLPWHSVHDGERLMHEPLRLAVCIAAPRAAIDGVLAKHPEVATLFDNRWLHLFALEEEGSFRRTGPEAWRRED